MSPLLFLVALVMPWPGEQGITITFDPAHPRPITSAIVYHPDGASFALRRRPVRANPSLASLRFPQQPSGTVIYVTVEQGDTGYGAHLEVP